MANGISTSELRTLAAAGLRAEIARLSALLLTLERVERASITAATTNGARPRRRRRKMSAAARAAVSRRMKAYWRGKRAAA